MLLVATTNRGKLEEIRAAVHPLEVRSLADFPELPVVDEDQPTFEGNARKKALEYAKGASCPALADDSGLCVEALNGAPGVHSARYAPGDDSARVAKLLEAMREVPEARRGAAFRCVLCLAWPDGRTVVEEGLCEGAIAFAPRGEGGFGYDPVFLDPELGRTFAELTREEKTARSHRGRALAKMIPHLKQLGPG